MGWSKPTGLVKVNDASKLATLPAKREKSFWGLRLTARGVGFTVYGSGPFLGSDASSACAKLSSPKNHNKKLKNHWDLGIAVCRRARDLEQKIFGEEVEL